MATRSYLPYGAQNRRAWLVNFVKKLEPIAPVVGVSAETIEKLKADCAMFSYAVDAKVQFRTKAQEWTEYASQADRGTGLNPVPSVLTIDAPPLGVEAGVFLRVAKIVSHIKTHPGYTVGQGKDLGIVAPESVPNTDELKPYLGIKVDNGRPVLSWSKKNAQGVEIHADRGTGSFTPVAVSLDTRYVDNAPLPPEGTGAVWKYKAIYRKKDSTIGQWSDAVSVGVFG